MAALGHLLDELRANGGEVGPAARHRAPHRPCRALILDIRYVNRQGGAARVFADSGGSNIQHATVRDVGSTAVTVDHSVVFDHCSANCSHTLQTKTK